MLNADIKALPHARIPAHQSASSLTSIEPYQGNTRRSSRTVLVLQDIQYTVATTISTETDSLNWEIHERWERRHLSTENANPNPMTRTALEWYSDNGELRRQLRILYWVALAISVPRRGTRAVDEDSAWEIACVDKVNSLANATSKRTVEELTSDPHHPCKVGLRIKPPRARNHKLTTS